MSESKDYNAPKGTIGMLEKFRTDDYNKLVDYIFDNGEEWRFERNAQNSIDDIVNNALTEVIIENCLGEF